MDFKDKKEFVKTHKKISIEHFDSVKDLTNMIDFLNKEIEETADKKADGDIKSISDFLERIHSRSTFILKKGK